MSILATLTSAQHQLVLKPAAADQDTEVGMIRSAFWKRKSIPKLSNKHLSEKKQ